MVERRSPKPNAGGSSPSTPATASPTGRATLVAGLALALLTALPFAFAVRPQQADYPAHLARYHIMLDAGQSPFLARYYEFTWALRGNLGVDLLMVPLGHLLGVETAARLIALLLPVLLGLAIVAVSWTLHRRVGVGAMLALATVWSPAMAMGFANFNLSLALALFAFAGWVRLENRRWRNALFVAIGAIVWVCHSAGWGVLGVMVFGYEWHRRKSWRALIAPWPLFLPIALMAAEPGLENSLQYGGNVLRYKLGIWLKALAETNGQFDLLSVIALAVAILAALAFRRIDGRLGWAALLIALLSLAIPRHFGGGDLADGRLVPVALMLGCLAINLRGPWWLLLVAPLLFGARLWETSRLWHQQSIILENALPALAFVPRGARVAAAIPFDRHVWGSAPLSHTGSYATLYRDALVNTNFAIPGVHMLRVKGAPAWFIDASQRSTAPGNEPVDLRDFAPATQADYLWYVGENPVKALPAGATVLYRAPGSLLARLAKPEPRR